MRNSIYVLIAGLILLLEVGAYAQEKPDEVPLFGDPAHLMDNGFWFAEQNKFRELGSETRDFLDLVTILYDWDYQRPWPDYFAVANARLSKFRERFCAELSDLAICKRPLMMSDAKSVGIAQAAVLNSEAIEILEKRFQVQISPWFLPGQDAKFSIVTAKSSRKEDIAASYWNLSPQNVSLTHYEVEVLPDAPNYRAGFESKDVPTILALTPDGPAFNDRQLKQRAVDFAAAWKRGVKAIRNSPNAHAIASSAEHQFHKLFENNSQRFESLHHLLRKKVVGLPAIEKRFELERTQQDYAEEVYQHVAYELLSDVSRVQAAYLTIANEQRGQLSQRQKLLESLLTMQRYTKQPQVFAMEMISLLNPLASSAFVLNQNIENKLATTFVLENIRALLGLGQYDGKALFPKLGASLQSSVLFDEYQDLAQAAPEVAEALQGRKFTSLTPQEQIEILYLYLEPMPGKVRAMALLRVGTLFYSKATPEELHVLADRIHQRIYGPKGEMVSAGLQ